MSKHDDNIYADLLAAAHSFCTTLTATLTAENNIPADPSIILSHFSTTPIPVIEEHGHKSLAPFIGRPFIGTDKVEQYFALQRATLRVEELQFPCLPEKKTDDHDHSHGDIDGHHDGNDRCGCGIPSMVRHHHHQEIEEQEEEIDEAVADLWIVDTINNMVSVTAIGKFVASQHTQHEHERERWEAKICYRLKLVREQRREVELEEWKIQRVDIWSDTGASKKAFFPFTICFLFLSLSFLLYSYSFYCPYHCYCIITEIELTNCLQCIWQAMASSRRLVLIVILNRWDVSWCTVQIGKVTSKEVRENRLHTEIFCIYISPTDIH